MSGKIVGYRYRSNSDSISLSVLQSRANFKNFKNFFLQSLERREVSFGQANMVTMPIILIQEGKRVFVVCICVLECFRNIIFCSKFFFCFFSIACSNCLPRRRSEQWAHHATDSSLYHRSKENFSFSELLIRKF